MPMEANQESAKRFVEEAISVTQQLVAIIGKPSAPDRSMVIERGQNVYEDLLRRRGSLVLSPMSEWAIDLLLDVIKTRLQILTDSSLPPDR